MVRTVLVVDTRAPVITRLGTSPLTVGCGALYTDSGATAMDVCDGDLTGSIVTVNPVNTAIPGTYTVTYDVSDASLNAAVQRSRTVQVVDVTAPVITLLGVSSETVECTGSYTDSGATAFDVCDGDLTGFIVTVNPVNTAVPGTYSVTYNVSDAASNAAVAVVRTVHVVDTTAPVLTLLGNGTETVECGTSYVDAGATAWDICHGDLTESIVTTGSVAPGTVGTYIVRYNVSDPAANAAVEIQRTVHVVDTLAPVLTLIGAAEVIIQWGEKLNTDSGANA